jgi:hypothetical protein
MENLRKEGSPKESEEEILSKMEMMLNAQYLER